MFSAALGFIFADHQTSRRLSGRGGGLRLSIQGHRRGFEPSAASCGLWFFFFSWPRLLPNPRPRQCQSLDSHASSLSQFSVPFGTMVWPVLISRLSVPLGTLHSLNSLCPLAPWSGQCQSLDPPCPLAPSHAYQLSGCLNGPHGYNPSQVSQITLGIHPSGGGASALAPTLGIHPSGASALAPSILWRLS